MPILTIEDALKIYLACRNKHKPCDCSSCPLLIGYDHSSRVCKSFGMAEVLLGHTRGFIQSYNEAYKNGEVK